MATGTEGLCFPQISLCGTGTGEFIQPLQAPGWAGRKEPATLGPVPAPWAGLLTNAYWNCSLSIHRKPAKNSTGGAQPG